MTCLFLTFATGCATTPVDSAICEATTGDRQALASALLDDGGEASLRAGERLLSALQAACG